MNHFADIDEGFEVFDDEQERKAAEATFRKQPNLVTLTVDGRKFVAVQIRTIHLVGSLRADRRAPQHPFDFEDGYLEAVVPITMTMSAPLAVRWSDYGKVTEYSTPR